MHGLKEVAAALGGEAAFGSFDVVQRGGSNRAFAQKCTRNEMHDPESNLWPLWSVLELDDVSKGVPGRETGSCFRAYSPKRRGIPAGCYETSLPSAF